MFVCHPLGPNRKSVFKPARHVNPIPQYHVSLQISEEPFLFLVGSQFLQIEVLEVTPMIIGSHVCMDRQCGFIFIEKYFEDRIFVIGRLAIEHELNITSHREYFEITPVLFVHIVEIGYRLVETIQAKQTGERHDHRVVTIAQGGSRMRKSSATAFLSFR